MPFTLRPPVGSIHLDAGRIWQRVLDFEFDPAVGGHREPVGLPGREAGCRFCGRRPPETAFREKAHVIPQFLGNRCLQSLDECDACNQRLGRTLDQRLADFLAFDLVLSARPGFKARTKLKIGGQTSYVAKEVDTKGLVINLKSEDGAEQAGEAVRLQMDRANDLAKVVARAPKVAVGDVVRAIGRLGLLCLPREELDRNRYLVEWVMGERPMFPLILASQQIRGLDSLVKHRLEVSRSRLVGYPPYCVLLAAPRGIWSAFLPARDGKASWLPALPRRYGDPATGREFPVRYHVIEAGDEWGPQLGFAFRPSQATDVSEQEG